jgi:hypothetical protein
MLLTLGLLTLAPQAQAFCGAYVGSVDDGPLSNHSSKVILARDGMRTTLTLSNDIQGSAGDFAMLIPVPSLQEEDVRVLDPTVVEAVENYSSPRLVSYTCEDFYEPTQRWTTVGCNDYYQMTANADAGSVQTSTVNVEAQFLVGEYEIVVLSAVESEDLMLWLESEGYGVPDSTSDLLQEYIDQGTQFMAAKISLNALEDGPLWLNPLQISYESETIGLPITLGTANSPGEQELIIYALTSWDDGQLAITNYPKRELETNDCMLEEGVDFSDHFYGELDQAFDNDDGQAGWVFEYGWAPYHCDPCVDGEALSENLVTELGFSQGAQGAYFSKLRMRYSPDQVTGDLNLVGSRITENEQVRYIEFNESMGDRFEVCGQGYVETLGDCYDTFDDLDQEQGRSNRGCSSRPLGRGWMVLGLLGMLVMGRRRAN